MTYALYFAQYASKYDVACAQHGYREVPIDYPPEWDTTPDPIGATHLKIGFTTITLPDSGYWDKMTCGEVINATVRLTVRRMRELSTGNPVPLEARWLYVMHNVYTAREARVTETWFHRHFAEYRIRSEWFLIPGWYWESIRDSVHQYMKETGNILCRPTGAHLFSHGDRASTVYDDGRFTITTRK